MRILLTVLVSFLFLESAHALNEELMAEARLIVQIKAKENFNQYEDENRDKLEKTQSAREQFNSFFEESNISALNHSIIWLLERGTEPIFGEFYTAFKGIKEALIEKDITVEKLFQN